MIKIVLDSKHDKQIEEIEIRIEDLRRAIRRKEDEVARDGELAAACDTEGWAEACKIFKSEQIRLALLHLKTLDKDDQAQIRGQALQMELLSEQADRIEQRLADGMRELENLKSSLAEEGNKLKALRRKR